MNFHVFALVWGPEFVRTFAELAIPYLTAPGNLPELAQRGSVTVHLYTDRESIPEFSPEIDGVRNHAEVVFHDFATLSVNGTGLDEHARNFAGPARKYEIQHHALSDLIDRLLVEDPSAILVLLDSNFVLSDGCLRTVAQRFEAGYNAVMVDALRLSRERADEAIRSLIAENGGRMGARALLHRTIAHIHSVTEMFFVDAQPFTPYPSQLLWRVGPTDILARSFIPHPLAIRITPKMQTRQGTMDYDLALRSWPDEMISMITDSDDGLVAKISPDAHHEAREGGATPDPRDMALFVISCTHNRHRQFAEQPVRFHVGERTGDWVPYEAEAKELIEKTYQQVDWIISNSARLDARLLAYIKSYTGNIENYLSPQQDARFVEPLRGGDGLAL